MKKYYQVEVTLSMAFEDHDGLLSDGDIEQAIKQSLIFKDNKANEYEYSVSGEWGTYYQNASIVKVTCSHCNHTDIYPLDETYGLMCDGIGKTPEEIQHVECNLCGEATKVYV